MRPVLRKWAYFFEKRGTFGRKHPSVAGGTMPIRLDLWVYFTGFGAQV
jgi:hypothetical protein